MSNVDQVSEQPPLRPESLIDLVHAIFLQTSDNSGLHAFGALVQRVYFEDLIKQYQEDSRASAYLRHILLTVGSTLKGFSSEKTRFKAVRAREEKLDELRLRLLEPKFVTAPFGKDSLGSLAGFVTKLGLSIPLVLGAFTRWGGVSSVPGVLAIVAGLLWFLAGDFFVAALVARSRVWMAALAGDPFDPIRNAWGTSFERYKGLAVDLLIDAERIRETYYPSAAPLLEGVRWNEVSHRDLRDFVARPHPSLGGRSPAQCLSAIVDLHFGLDPKIPPRYSRLDATDGASALGPAHPVASHNVKDRTPQS